MAGPRLLPPDQWAEKQVRNTQNSGEDWIRGMNSPRKDPKAAALAATEKHKNNTMRALQENAYAKGIARINEAEVLATVNALGSGVFTQGVAARTEKIKRRVSELHGKLTTHVGRMDALPTATEADRDAKMLANLKGMRNLLK